MDRTLAAALREIEEIMEKYDLGGAISLISRDDNSHMLKIDPSWSCAKLNEEGVVLKALPEDFESTEERNTVLRNTFGLLLRIGDLADISKDFSEQMRHFIQKKFTSVKRTTH